MTESDYIDYIDQLAKMVRPLFDKVPDKGGYIESTKLVIPSPVWEAIVTVLRNAERYTQIGSPMTSKAALRADMAALKFTIEAIDE